MPDNAPSSAAPAPAAPAPAAPAPAAPAPAAPAPQNLFSAGKEGAAPAAAAESASFEFYKDGKPTDAFLKAIPESRKSVRSLVAKYKDWDSLMGGLENAQHLAGQKGFEKPADDAPQSVKDAFAAKLRTLNGVPETAEGYGLKKPDDFPAGLQWDDGMASEAMKIAHEEGISPKALHRLVELQMKGAGGQVTAMKAEQDRLFGESVKTIREAFGSGTSEALRKAQGAAEFFKLGTTDANGVFTPVDPFINAAMNYSPALVMALHAMAERSGESVVLPGAGMSDRLTSENQLKEMATKASAAAQRGDTKEYNRLTADMQTIAARLGRKK